MIKLWKNEGKKIKLTKNDTLMNLTVELDNDSIEVMENIKKSNVK